MSNSYWPTRVNEAALDEDRITVTRMTSAA